MRNKLIFVLLIPVLWLTACGITEELEQAKADVTDLTLSLTEQAKNYQELDNYIEAIPEAFIADLAVNPETGLFTEKTGEVYDNFILRQELASEMTDHQKEIKKIKKDLDRIVKKNGVDVDNAQLKLISRSLKIVTSNFDSLQVYIDASVVQEEEFYEQMPTDKMAEELSIIQRTYGAMEIVSEEAQANITYTLSLIKTFEKEAIKSKEHGK